MKKASLADLVSLWTATDCKIVCPDSAHLLRQTNLMHKFRGALGHELARSASPEALVGQPCSFSTPCAYDMFHNSQGRLAAGLEIPKPFVLRAERQGNDLVLSTRLFGRADNWKGDILLAMIAAARRGLHKREGIDVLEVSDAAIVEAEQPPKAESLGADIQVTFLTPWVRRVSGRNQNDRIATLITGLANRVSGIARWHGVTLELDGVVLKASAQAAAHSCKERLRLGCADRGAGRPRDALIGSLELVGVPDLAMTLLCLGTSCQAGADTTIGRGRYTIATRGVPPLT